MDNPFLEFQRLYANDPVRFAREVLGADPMPHQAEVMNEVVQGAGHGKGRRISIRSGHGTGKSWTLAVLIVWHSVTRAPQVTLVTAPTSTQLFDALAAEVKAMFKSLPEALRELFDIKSESIELRALPDKSFVSFATSRAETPEALAGKHSDHMLIIADEASGVPDAVFNAARGSMSGSNACTILAGNPIRTSGLFFDTHHTLAHRWTTFQWSCVGNPRVDADFFEDAEASYGLDSNEYRIRVLGEFPKQEADQFIPFELVQLSLTREVAPIPVKAVWGVDPGRGGDATAIAKRQGNVLVEPVIEFKNLELMEVVGRVKAMWDATPDLARPEMICVDAIGIGAGVADRLNELGLPCRAVNVSESPALANATFLNMKTELWAQAEAWFRERTCNLCDDRETAAELSLPRKTYTSSGKMQVQRKKELKKSPNRAEAFVMTFAAPAVSAVYGSSASTQWKEPLRRDIKCLV